MTPTELKAWTFEVAVRVVKFVEVLPHEPRSWVLGKQLLRSGTSVGAQYRAACRAQSARDFISKMKKMEEEADESVLWLALLRATGLSESLAKESERLESEYDRLTAIAVSSSKTAERRAARAAKH
jgi:four helix bundle protein